MSVLICNVPKLEGFYLPPTLAILKGGCTFLGIESKSIDFNIDFIDECNLRNIPYASHMANVSKDHIPDDAFRNTAHELIAKWSGTVVNEKPSLLAISVFSHFSQYFAKQLCKAVKELDSTIPIIVGGSGITYSIAQGPEFAIELHNEGLIDYYINDDAEVAWPTFLSTFFSLPMPNEINKNYLNISYSPDYSDYDIARYEKYRTTTGLLWVPVTGSKGCIRNCTFCEIPATWKFVQRSASHIIADVAAAVKIADNIRIHFTDSLLNGSLSEFNRVLDGLIDLQQASTNTFQWGGQFIARPDKVDNWEKMEASGCRMLEIGFETGSDTLRYEMDKKFTNNDLIYALSMMEKHNIQCILLMFCSYPTETLEQFEETLEFFRVIQQYSSTVRAVQLNFSFCVFENTPLYKNRKVIKLQTTSDPTQWTCETNPTLTFKERVRRRLLTQEHLENLGYRLTSDVRTALVELVSNYIRYQQGKQYTFDEMALEVLGRPTTIKYRY
jgi:hypothetical protein